VLTSKLVDVVKHESLDLLHVHYAIPHASAAYMAQRILEIEGINIPFITTLHGTDITLVGRDASFEPSITFAINQSNAVTTVSQSLKDDTLKHFEVARDIEVIPNFVCMREYDGEPDKKLHAHYAPNGEKLLVHISNFRKVKRVEDLVKIFKKVRDVIPAKMVLVGDGPERSNIERLCRELGTCGDIVFVGKVESPAEILKISDLFLLTSETESFGLAALEAMASKTPVISTNSGGLPEVNDHGVSGFLSNVGDVDDMAKNALHILQDEDRLNKFKEGAYTKALTFSMENILPKYEALYERLASGVLNSTNN